MKIFHSIFSGARSVSTSVCMSLYRTLVQSKSQFLAALLGVTRVACHHTLFSFVVRVFCSVLLGFIRV